MDLRKFDRFSAMLQPEKQGLPKIKSTNTTIGIQGAQPDAYGRLRNIKGRDYNAINDIEGARPKYMAKPFP
jgi:hypothetical protein